MASMRVCVQCKGRYRRSKNRHYGLSFCSDRCRWVARDIPIDIIYERDNKICHLCDKFVPREEASRDHVRPKSLGGRLDYDNIRLAHASCNSRRGSRPVNEFRDMLDRLANATRPQTQMLGA